MLSIESIDSVAFGISSAGLMLRVSMSSLNIAVYFSVYSFNGIPSAFAPAIVLSSMSVMFMACFTL
jgi:hypothetical protein